MDDVIEPGRFVEWEHYPVRIFVCRVLEVKDNGMVHIQTVTLGKWEKPLHDRWVPVGSVRLVPKDTWQPLTTGEVA